MMSVSWLVCSHLVEEGLEDSQRQGSAREHLGSRQSPCSVPHSTHSHDPRWPWGPVGKAYA